MKRTLRRQKSAYVLSLIFCSIWLATFLLTIWKIWPRISSTEDPVSTFLALLWEENLSLLPGLQIRLIYLTILGDVMLISGVVTWFLSRKWFALPGEITVFQCPFCKKRWRSKGDRALVHCQHCRQLVHPKIVSN